MCSPLPTIVAARPPHVGDMVAVPGGDLADQLLGEERPVGGVECRPVAHVELVLAGLELAHHPLQLQVDALGGVVERDQQTVGLLHRRRRRTRGARVRYPAAIRPAASASARIT